MTRGGKRAGAGRPAGSGKYGEKTTVMRVPASMVEKVSSFISEEECLIPLYQSKVSAGFPSPADDYVEEKLNLNDHLISNPPATFFVRATGESMTGVGIFPDDLLVVDRSVTPRHGDIIIAAVDGELTVKRLHQSSGKTALIPENPKFSEILLEGDMELNVWGVVKYVVHSLKDGR